MYNDTKVVDSRHRKIHRGLRWWMNHPTHLGGRVRSVVHVGVTTDGMEDVVARELSEMGVDVISFHTKNLVVHATIPEVKAMAKMDSILTLKESSFWTYVKAVLYPFLCNASVARIIGRAL